MKRVYELGLKFQEGKHMPQAGQQNFITSKATGWHTPNLSRQHPTEEHEVLWGFKQQVKTCARMAGAMLGWGTGSQLTFLLLVRAHLLRTFSQVAQHHWRIGGGISQSLSSLIFEMKGWTRSIQRSSPKSGPELKYYKSFSWFSFCGTCEEWNTSSCKVSTPFPASLLCPRRAIKTFKLTVFAIDFCFLPFFP